MKLHKLTRVVRFSVNPFLPETPIGANSYSSKPSGEGLGIYLCLEVTLEGYIERDTGFVVNLTDIDKYMREFATPVFDSQIRRSYRAGKHIDFAQTLSMLKQAINAVDGCFEKASVVSMSLQLNPFKRIAVFTTGDDMFYYSEKFEFAAMHKLWNEEFSEEKNFDVFGKCANPAGHGHNYIIEVKIAHNCNGDFSYGNFAKTVDDNFLSLLDHKNLNVDVEFFKDKITTLENITTFGWNQLNGKFGAAKLEELTIWENDRAYCSYRGE